MIRKLAIALFCLLSQIAYAVTINVNSGMSQATIQGLVNGGNPGDIVAFAAGTYNWAGTLNLNCSLTYTGPVANPSTAILNATNTNISLMTVGSTCSALTITYLHFQNSGGIYFPFGTNPSNVTITHNQFTGMHWSATALSANAMAGIYLIGDVNSTSTNFTVEYNTFGDSSTCSEVMDRSSDDGGNCIGWFIQNGIATNMVFRYNTVNHIEEGVHIPQQVNYTGQPQAESVCDGCDFEYNTWLLCHRICLEIQNGVVNHATIYAHNFMGNPYHPTYGTLTFSGACCQYGRTQTVATPLNPGLLDQDNVEINSLPSSQNSPFAHEMWGQGTLVENNIVHGSFCDGVAWGNGAGAWTVQWNVIQGQFMAAQTPCNTSNIASGFLVTEQNRNNPPAFVNNQTGSTPTAVQSMAPVISPTPTGTYSAPISVTLSIPTNASAIPSGLNTIIYYTTDGSTPTTSSTICNTPPATSCNFSVAQGSTVNAISMWGYQDATYTQVGSGAFPSGYGYVQSGVVSAHYSAGSTPVLSGVSLSLTGGGSSVQVGNSIQAIATCSYTGPTQTTNCTTTDAYGTTANTWASSNTTDASISSSGVVTGLAAGTANLTVHAGSFSNAGSPFALTVNPAAPVLQSVTLSCPSPITTGQTSTCTANCNYSGPQVLNCTTTDAQGNVASGWTSSNTGVATMSGNVATGVSAGMTSITATAGGIPSQPVGLTVNSPPPAGSLTGVTVACTNGSVTVGSTTTCKATCSYFDGTNTTTTDCTVTDAHGTLASSWTSSVPADATINSTTGILTGVAPGSTNVSVTAAPAPGGTAYFMSPTGSDSNNGLSTGSPWLSPNHALNCGDTITAASGTYSASNFQNNKWGTVTCTAGNNVAWLICATFDTCKVSSTSSDAMWISKSYWGVVGWEATTSTTSTGACFHIGPTASSTVVHHIVMADNVANGCMGGGITAYDLNTTASVDYIVYIGNIVYNAAQGTGACYSGLNIYQPIQSDGNSGTHMYVAGNFSYDNVDGPSCDSAGAGKTTDGEGINFDTFDFSQGGGTAYAQQGVIQNNIELLNGTRGIEVENNGYTHSTAGAPIIIKYNTGYGSGKDPNMAFPGGIAELGFFQAFNLTVTNNLVYTGHQFTTGTNSYFALGMANGNGTDTVDNNYAAGVSGNNTYLQTSGSFSYGSGNVLGTNPSFASATDPGAPSCGSFSSTTACMATVIANFTPTVTAARAYGYQAVSNTSIVDSLFPQWLCVATGVMNTHIPAGLVTPGCGVGSGFTAPPVAVPVVAAPSTAVLGNNQFNTVGGTSANYINATYAVTGTATAGYPVTSCSFYLPTGTTYTAGSKWDCGLVLAPTSTTQSSSWLCHATYTTLGTSADVGWHTLNLVNCGTLPPSTAYWISVDTNEMTPTNPGSGFWNCGSSCTGSVPTSGNGTYACSYISASYGVYTGMGTAMSHPCGLASPLVQGSQYVTLTLPTATFVGASIAPVGFANTLVVGGTFNFTATCSYSDGTSYSCYPTADQYGNTVTSWTSSNTSVLTIGQIGSAHPGLATGVAPGFSNVQATITGGHGSSLWGITINPAPPPFGPNSSSKVFSR